MHSNGPDLEVRRGKEMVQFATFVSLRILRQGLHQPSDHKQQHDAHRQGGGHGGGLQGLEAVGEQQHGGHHSYAESPDDAETLGGWGSPMLSRVVMTSVPESEDVMNHVPSRRVARADMAHVSQPMSLNLSMVP